MCPEPLTPRSRPAPAGPGPALRRLAGLLALAALAGPLAAPAEARDGELPFQARVEADPGGREGRFVLVVETRFTEPGLHVKAVGEDRMVWRTIPVPGVTYEEQAATQTEPQPRVDPNYPEEGPKPAWTGSFMLRIPFRADPGAGPREVGVTFDYGACTHEICYQPVRGQEVRAGLPSANPEARPAPDPPPDEWVLPGGPGREAPAGGAVVAGGGAALHVRVEEAEGGSSRAIVGLEPAAGWHLTLERGWLVLLPSEGVEWGEFEARAEPEFSEPLETVVPFRRTALARVLRLEAAWTACSERDGICLTPTPRRAEVPLGGEPRSSPSPEPSPPAPPPSLGDVLFPVRTDDDLGALGAGDASASDIAGRVSREGFLAVLLSAFALGLGLTLTPCVLPIIPVTVSVIAGGKAGTMPRRTLTARLLVYVAGLSLTFGGMGVFAALGGATLSAAFEVPAVQWAISGLFVLLAFGMLGVYELQPPAWLLRIQGGAQRRSASYVGVFLLGALAAVIASPCTGPFIAAVLVYAAQSGSPLLGFLLFVSIGLGMGAVFFTVGSLNFALRPGPWMVWVRYALGVLLVGVALYYLGLGRHLSSAALLVAGLVLAALAGGLVVWHLRGKEGEEAGPALRKGAWVGALIVAVTGLAALLTRPPQELDWTVVRDRDHLVLLVAEARERRQPVVVDFWATWCTYCLKYDEVIAAAPDLLADFGRVRRLKVDLTRGPEAFDPVREALGVPRGIQPFLVFLDGEGAIRRNADIRKWHGRDAADALRVRLNLVLGS
jgi:thiol:disulfide interchange protein DsbD